jgi:hypothetical protein
MTPQQIQAVRAVARAIVQSVREVGTAPAGPMFAALMGQGCTLNQFTQIMGQLVRAGFLTHDAEGHTYSIGDKPFTL